MNIVFLPCILILASPLLHAGESTWQSPAGRRASLVELYTSEGCSSCPPAEAWLSHLTASPRLWTDFVPVSFHVDYWDNLGWKDRFAAPAWTTRQRAYAGRWGSSTVYTPGFVRDGQEWQHSSDAPEAGKGGGLLTATVKDNKAVTVTYPAGTARRATVALLGFGLASKVKAGENRGRDLQHDFVVLALESKPLDAEGKAAFELPPGPPDATRLGVAAWVESSAGTVEQATGGFLK